MKHVCIIGSGAAGNLLLLNLQKAGVAAECVTIIDQHHDGGDLQRKWGFVRSNTIWQQVLDACPCSEPISEPWASLDPQQPSELRMIGSYLQHLVREYQCDRRTGTVNSITRLQDKWVIETRDKKMGPVTADVLLLAHGSESKSLDMPFASIPLHIALDRLYLERFLQNRKIKTVAVFGTAHSGTLIVKNLLDLGYQVVNFYATPKPFYFARDGEYDGIKQDAAVIADEILANKYETRLRLIPIQDTAAVIRASKYIDMAVYATGFEQRNTFGLSAYDATTGKILDVQNAWGFGIAYPNLAENGKHYDVGVPSFQTHIAKQMPDILAALSSAQ
jgi:cation diffusion facilitator CzcD-associated flavoprotein CzcO